MPALVALEVGLVVSGALSVGRAVAIGIAVELALWVTVASRLVVGARHFGRARHGGAETWEAAEAALAMVVPRPVARFVLLEPRLWVCAARWATRRMPPPGPDDFGYAGSLRQLFVVVIGLVVVEGLALDLAVAVVVAPPGPWLALVAALHGYALVVLLGLRASFTGRPHHLAREALRLRDGIFARVEVPWAAMVAARVAARPNTGRSGFKTDAATATGVLAYGDANVVLALDPAHPLTVNGDPCAVPLTSLWLTVDEPRRLVEALRGARRPSVDGRGTDDRPARSAGCT